MATTETMSTNESASPAEPGMWLFIFADMCIFATYFGVFAWDKARLPEQFINGQATLSTWMGGLNTIILLISSFFMASAVHAARAGNITRYLVLIKITMLCGLAFLVVKVFEYSAKFSAGIYLDTNVFYRDYFAFTGFHMLHVLIGMALLSYLLIFIRNPEDTRANIKPVEGIGLYWHMVDLLWVVLFALIYLVP
jgi:nitric oxide reductase NorE protein